MVNSIIYKFNTDGTTEVIANPSNSQIVEAIEKNLSKLDMESHRKLLADIIESYVQKEYPTYGYELDLLWHLRNFEGNDL